jgi:hypothetical protein
VAKRYTSPNNAITCQTCIYFQNSPKWQKNALQGSAADCEVRTHASFDNGDLSKLKTYKELDMVLST